MSDRVFSYEEALATLPLVEAVTRRAVRRVEALVNAVQSFEEGKRRRQELDGAVRQIVRGWAEEIAEVGCEPKGLWLVDWDSGDGYFCWRFPEPTIGHFHGYEDGFAGRVPIQ